MLLGGRRERRRRKRCVRSRVPRPRLAFEVAVGFLFFRLTVKLADPIRASLTSERHADLPRPREDLGILDRRLVANRVRIEHGVALDDVQGVAVKVARLVEPRQVAQVRDVDDERVALPAAA